MRTKRLSQLGWTTWIEANTVINIVGAFLLESSRESHPLHDEPRHDPSDAKRHPVSAAAGQFAFQRNRHRIGEDEVAPSGLSRSRVPCGLGSVAWAGPLVLIGEKIDLD